LIHANRELERQRDRANIAASASENVTAFLLDIFKASNPANADAGKVTARELLERGHARIEKDVALDNRTRVRLLVALGDAYGSLGLHEEAIVLYRQALATLEPDTDPSGRVQLLGKLGLALQFARHNREARDMLADATGTEGWETLDFTVTFDLRRALAAAERSLGNLAESARLLDALLGDARAHFGPDAQLTLDVGARLVAVYSTMAEYERALALTDALLPLARRAMGENHPITSYLLGNLGGIYMDLDRWDDAERINRQIYERFLEQFGPEGSPTQIAAATLAVSIPDRHEGLRMLRELEARQVEQYGPDAPQLVITVLDVAWVLSRVPAREADAWREYERALDLATRHYGEHHPILGTIHYGFAALHARNGNDAGALKHFRVASAKPSLQYRAARDPDFAALRGVPEFVTLLGRFGDAEPVLP
ncbi:MAG TPA: tetratricopeptide repeat protein, partial [Gammaproteobacteria bacterium]